ncbi:predicted protein [Micromonas commoda]|jgi:hypothetical protein|uniref:DRBM domain-containing protein n=1 Tax=Micromonas commoda (strain RCC299 / NOUM17 / CCMP2709) TaxID=296587 RepID=C1EDI7_MICCC|nr:predicted protein [Micromonas commoda]ACO66370.1 predicted protein [Micromonas commoda]|eukprot:XP_002505112.1 predicted protein [Micromonas commoda]
MATAATVRGTKRAAPSQSPGDEDEVDARCGVHPRGRAPGEIRRSFAADAASAAQPEEPSTSSSPYVQPANIHVAYTSKQIDAYVRAEFYPNDEEGDSSSDGGGGIRLVGLDVEARPSRVKGVTHPVALVQVTTPDNRGCLLAHVYGAMGLSPPTPNRPYVPGSAVTKFPPLLARLLHDPNVLPVGQGVAEDLRQIARCFPEVTNPGVPKGGAEPGCRRGAFVDLASIVDFYDVPASGLGRLAQHCGFSDVSKPKSVQVSDWSRTPLTDAQVRYAAQDACLSLWVLERLFAIYAPPGVNLHTWASAFAGCETRKDVASRCKRLDGVIDVTMRAHMRARLERWRDEEGDANYVKAFRKCSLALARHDAGVDAGERGVNARSTLAQLAQFLNVRIRFDHARDRNPDGGLKGGPNGGATATCILDDGETIGRGRGVNKKRAIMEAARDALRHLRATKDGEWWCESLVKTLRGHEDAADLMRATGGVAGGLEWACGHGDGGGCERARSGVAAYVPRNAA